MKTIRRCASKLRRTVIEWFRYYIFFSKAVLLISGLVFSHSLAEHAVVSILISYLTDKWKNDHLPQATSIVNVEEGVSAIMVIVIAHISDAYTGRFKMIVLSNAAYIIGMVSLSLAAWLLTPNTEVRIFYVAVVLLALGKAGKEPPLRAFLADQMGEQEQNPSAEEEQVEARTKIWWRFARFLGAVAAVFLTNLDWKYIFLVSAVVKGVAYLFFWCGISFYYCKKPKGSPLTSVIRVFKVALWKRHLDYPRTASDLFKNDSNQLPLLPRIPCFRWLDKAAIVESSALSPDPYKEEKEGKLCTVMQVEEVKRLLEMVPMWTTFLVYRLVEATGSTFFIEQTNNLIIPKIGGSSYNIIVSLLVLRSFSCFIISYLYELIIPKRWTKAKRRHAMLVRIGVGMACSILCCIAACLVEVHRLKLIKRKNLQNDTDEPISMSVFWLVPQFFLIGLMEGLAEDGLDNFFSDQVSESMARYGPPINECALGIGKFLNVLCVFVFRSWFGRTINSSHLDKYYTMLAALSLGNLCFYYIVSTCIFAQNEAQRVEVELVGISVVDATDNLLSTKTDQSFSRSMTWPYRLRSLYRRSSRKVVVQAGLDAL